MATEHNSNKTRRLRERSLEAALTSAKRLNVLLNDPDTWQQIAIHCDPKSVSPRLAVQELIKALGSALKPKPQPQELDVEAGKRLADELGIGRLSHFEWLAGEHLPELFQKHFSRKASGRRSDGLCDTPYIRFVTATLAELAILNSGTAYAPETIARALAQAKKPRKRKS